MLSKQQAYEIIDLIKQHSNYYTTVSIVSKEEGLTRFSNSEIHQNVISLDTEVSINVIHDKKISQATTNVIDEAGLLEALRSAEEKLAFLPEGDVLLPELKDLPEISVENYNPQLANAFGITQRAQLLKKYVSLLDEGFSAAGAFSLTHTSIAWGNTHNVKRYYSSSNANKNVMIIHENGASGYADFHASKVDELNPEAAFTFAYTKAKEGLNPISIEPGAYDVVLEPMAVCDLLSFTGYIGAASKMHKMGMSCFAGKLQQQVLGTNITITDDASHPAISGIPFDFEGYPRQTLPIIDKGVFKGIAYDTSTALEVGKETTGHSFGYKGEGGYALNLLMEAGDASIEEMIKSTKKGLLVSRFHYMNVVNPKEGVLTALTRDGLFLIEEGKVVSPVHNLRFTDSVFNIFNNVESITSECLKSPSFYGFNYIPGAKVKGFVFTGKTTL